jgi:hypothetical protein
VNKPQASEKDQDVCEEKKSEPPAQPPSDPMASGEMPEQTEKEVHVEYNRLPSTPPPGQVIHPRQKIPPVPEGEDVADASPSPPVELD